MYNEPTAGEERGWGGHHWKIREPEPHRLYLQAARHAETSPRNIWIRLKIIRKDTPPTPPPVPSK